MTSNTIRSCRQKQRGGGEEAIGEAFRKSYSFQEQSKRGRGPLPLTHHVHGPAALSDAVGVQHMEDPAPGARIWGEMETLKTPREDGVGLHPSWRWQSPSSAVPPSPLPTARR